MQSNDGSLYYTHKTNAGCAAIMYDTSIHGTSYKQEQVEAVESMLEPVYCSAHFSRREVSLNDSTACEY
jgi:hypothetical protein